MTLQPYKTTPWLSIALRKQTSLYVKPEVEESEASCAMGNSPDVIDEVEMSEASCTDTPTSALTLACQMEMPPGTELQDSDLEHDGDESVTEGATSGSFYIVENSPVSTDAVGNNPDA
ncbi:hypothetical protein PENARI_c005G05956 [Penicillium arizonense]|uniref:Uncharacterized protein n=1 Tax=Penicillium arizonense TaxID=1835702 RepID=A0A1F5LPM7_PENAI|nr:hypothetical protein PENARI_c005G05956 [Penicillium arizonense]OGE55172.1 hypothetical protein PENARI_c005G05956 [Penicillium arizonense]